MTELYKEHVEDFHIYELLTGMQFFLQAVIENFILLDRAQYLRETSDEPVLVEVLEIFDENLSPRNKVIKVVKKSSSLT